MIHKLRHLQILKHLDWQMPLTMVVGSIIAGIYFLFNSFQFVSLKYIQGMTSEGGGAVAFPVGT
jgi:hypothetical protein